jgi:asparaginyl-tRNA synthetase
MSVRLSIKKVFKDSKIGDDVKIAGWIRSVRKNKTFCFIVLNDGSCQDNLQIVVNEDVADYERISNLLTGSAVGALGKVVESGGKGQSIELQGTDITIYGEADNTYPLQKKGTSLEFLRENAHLRVRTNLFGAVFRIRHTLAMATHNFFHEKGYYYLNSPIITGHDAEGAGEMFAVSTLNPGKLPTNDKGEIDYSKDYFGTKAHLAVSGQLEAECHAMGLGGVYTFGPTFRSENSNTPRHLSEFWMVEPEVAFADLDDVAELASEYIKRLISDALEHNKAELDFLKQWRKWQKIDDENHQENLIHVRDSKFKKITYTEAIDILIKSGEKFEYKPEWGVELQTEHERFLAEKHFNVPVIVTDYPKSCKAFYMKQNEGEEENRETVRAMDVLVPGVGELIGGSQREDSLSKLEGRIAEMGMDKDVLWWYLDLRKYGSVPHAGFGLGFERAVMYVTGMKNIRDVIAFPRTPKSADF